MPGYAESDTCACGGAVSHAYFPDVRVWWCAQCGAWRRPFEGRWRVPLGAARDVAQGARFVVLPDGGGAPPPDDVPTRRDLGRGG